MKHIDWLSALRQGIRRTIAQRHGKSRRAFRQFSGTGVERLEDRILLTVSRSFRDGVLTLTGTDENDVFLPPATDIHGNGTILIDPETDFRVHYSKINKIVVDAFGGDDIVFMAGIDWAKIEINGGPGNDDLTGGDLNDVIDGGTGSDIIRLSPGADAILGGSAISLPGDAIFFDFENVGQMTIGNGTLSFQTAANGSTVIGSAQFSGIELIRVWGSEGGDIIDGSQATIPLNLFGEEGNDTLRGGTVKETDSWAGIYGGPGDDALFGGSGDSWISGGEGNDTIRGGSGNDYLTGDEGHDFIYGDAGKDVLIGGTANASEESAANDHLEGGSDDDRLYSRDGGNDTLLGNTGNDWLVWTHTVGQQMTLDGGSDNDLLSVETSVNSAEVSQPSGSTDIELSLESESFDAASVEQFYLNMTSNAGVTVDVNEVSLQRMWVLTQSGQDTVVVPPSADSVIEDLYIDTGDQADTVVVHLPKTGENGAEITIETGGGDDRLTIHAAPMDSGIAEVSIGTGGGTDTLELVGTDADVDDQIYLTQYRIDPGEYTPGIEDAPDGAASRTDRIYMHWNQVRIQTDQTSGSRLENLKIETRDGDDTVGVYVRELAADATLSSLTVQGGGGNDIIGMYGAQQFPKVEIYGEADHDILLGGPGRETLDGGAGDDVLFGEGFEFSATTLSEFLSRIEDFLTGSKLNFSGALVPMSGSQDTLLGGSGNDLLVGGDKDDEIHSGTGNSIVFGDSFALGATWSAELKDLWMDPIVVVDFESSATHRGSGNDLIYGSKDGVNVVLGGAGNDTIHGVSSEDLAAEGSVKGDGGLDLLFGNEGSDTIHAYGGTNFMLGGAGNDTLSAGADGESGGLNVVLGDSLALNEATTSLIFDSFFGTNTNIVPFDFLNLFSLAETGDDTLTLLSGASLALGGDGADTITGADGGLDLLFGNHGDDSILAGSGTNFVAGGDGDDQILRAGESEGQEGTGLNIVLGDSLTLNPGPVNLVISGLFDENTTLVPFDFLSLFTLDDTGNDTIDVKGGINLVLGGEGDDTINGSASGLDLLFGNDGADRILAGGGTNFVVGGDGNDQMLRAGVPGQGAGDALNVVLGDSIVLNEGVTNLVLSGLFTSDTMPVPGDFLNLFKLADTGGNDTIQVHGGTSLVLGGAGNDTITGSSNGFDVLFGNKDHDTIRGREGFDIIVGGDGNDLLEGATAVDDKDANIILGDSIELNFNLDFKSVLTATLGAFVFPSVSAAVKLTDSGDDTIKGGNGVDLLIGGAGKDEIHGRDGTNVAFGDDFDLGIVGDVFDFFGAVFNPVMAVKGVATKVEAEGKKAVKKVYDYFTGSEGNGKIVSNADLYEGGSGTDIVFGGDGTDTIRGHDGYDFLVGGDDDDWITNGDILDSGSGSDEPLFDFAFGGHGNDTIEGGGGDDFLGSTIGDDLFIGHGGDDIIFAGDGNDSLFGGEGDDQLFGEAGDDLLDGGPGHNLLVQDFLEISPLPDRSFRGLPELTVDVAPVEGETHEYAKFETGLKVTVEQFGLHRAHNDFVDWGGLGEKWVLGTEGWYFITPAGTLYSWNGTRNDLLASPIVAKVDPAVHADLTLLASATSTIQTVPVSNDQVVLNRTDFPYGATLVTVVSTRGANVVHRILHVTNLDGSALATEIDREFGLYTNGNLFVNWARLGEKWLEGNGGWYYVTPDGSFYHWERSGPTTLVGSVGTQLFDNIDLLYHANAIDLDEQLGLYWTGRFYRNWAGLGEKWLMGRNGWYFVTADGTVYDYDGVSVENSQVVGQVETSYFPRTSELYDALDITFTRWESLDPLL